MSATSTIKSEPGISGRQLATRLQERSPQMQVIFISGYSADIAGRELTLQEGQNFLQKPCAQHELLLTIRRCLDLVPDSSARSSAATNEPAMASKRDRKLGKPRHNRGEYCL